MAWAGIGLGGCLERTVKITSEPPGAVVWMNNVEVGRTPVETGFTFYGKYDVRLRREGYEPLSAVRDVRAPLYEYPPLDLLAEAAPLPIRTERSWHFELEPTIVVEGQAEADLIARARAMEAELPEKAPPKAAPAPAEPAEPEPVAGEPSPG
jgi:hypothetical protein